MEEKSAIELKNSYLSLLQELGAKRKNFEKKWRERFAKIHTFRVYVTTKNHVNLPIVVEAQDQGTAQLLVRAQFPDARCIGSAVKIK